MRYALLAFSNAEIRDRVPEEERRRINAGIAAVLERPNVGQRGRVLASLVRYLGDIELAEDAAQEASRSPRSTGRVTENPRTRPVG